MTLTSDLVFRIIISGTYHLYGNPKFGVWMHLGMVECLYHLQVTVTLNLTSNLGFRIIVSGVYLILFEVGIPNLVCECILEW